MQQLPNHFTRKWHPLALIKDIYIFGTNIFVIFSQKGCAMHCQIRRDVYFIDSENAVCVELRSVGNFVCIFSGCFS